MFNSYENEEDIYLPEVVLEMVGYSPANPKHPTKTTQVPIDKETTIHELFSPIVDFIVRSLGISENVVFSYLKALQTSDISSLEELSQMHDSIDGIDEKEFEEFRDRMKNPKFIWYLYKIYMDDIEGR